MHLYVYMYTLCVYIYTDYVYVRMYKRCKKVCVHLYMHLEGFVYALHIRAHLTG